MLTLENLDKAVSSVHLPDYNISDIQPGIVHFGVGNFFRAHEALYIDNILKAEPTWGIIGVGLTNTEHSRQKAATFKAQDCLYSLTECAPDGRRSVRVIAALRDYLLAAQDPQQVLAHLSNAKTRIVSIFYTHLTPPTILPA